MPPRVVGEIGWNYVRALPEHKAACDAIVNLEVASERLSSSIQSAVLNVNMLGQCSIRDEMWVEYKAAAESAVLAVAGLRAVTQAQIPGGGVA